LIFAGGSADIVQSFSSLAVSDGPKVQVTTKCQNAASTFCDRMANGLGFLPTCVRFDPTYNFDNSVHSMLVPSHEEILSAPRLRLRGERMGLQTWGETGPGGVHQQFSAVQHQYTGLEDNGQKQLGSRQLGRGIATRSSYEDSHHRFGNYILSDMEHKGAESSVLRPLSQGAATATNFAMGLLDAGIPRDKCIIPVFANTGLTFLAGATIVLDCSFPTFIPISKQLDLSDPVERQVASAFIAKASRHCEWMFNLRKRDAVETCLIEPLALALDDLYYVKTVTAEVYRRGLGLFASHTQDHTDIEIGMHHMIDALNLVYASDARQFAEYPLSIRTPDASSNDCYQIIYRDLTKLGFRIGVPNRSTNGLVYDLYVKALTDAVTKIHSAGVIHVDLYFSNVMWRYVSDVMEIKIIDWDAAHCLDEEKFVDAVKRSLDDYLGGENVQFGVNHDLLYLSVLSLDINPYESLWESLASDQKRDVDAAFRELLTFAIRS
jgi:hypothetical protein